MGWRAKRLTSARAFHPQRSGREQSEGEALDELLAEYEGPGAASGDGMMWHAAPPNAGIDSRAARLAADAQSAVSGGGPPLVSRSKLVR